MRNRIKLTVINDNEPGSGLLNSWGWSIHVSTDKWEALFDADSEPEIIRYNSTKLGVSLSNISFAFLSHHHGDHSGGFPYIATIKPGLKVYVPPGPIEYLSEIGLTPVVITKPVKIREDVWSTGPLRSWFIKEHGMIVEVSDNEVLVIVGCSHPGIDRIVDEAIRITGKKIHMVIGGFHGPPREALERIAQKSEIICPAHCSGDYAKAFLKKNYPEKYCDVRTGSVIEIN